MNATIKDRVDAFVADLSALIRQAALEAIHQSLGADMAPARRVAGRASTKPGARKKTASGTARKQVGGRAGGGSSADAGALLEQIRREPGLRLEEIARALGTTTAHLRPAIDQLLKQGQVRTEGQARGTRYLIGSGKAPRSKASKKRAPSKKSASKKKPASKKKKKAGSKKRKKTTQRATSAGQAA